MLYIISLAYVLLNACFYNVWEVCFFMIGRSREIHYIDQEEDMNIFGDAMHTQNNVFYTKSYTHLVALSLELP